MKIILASASPRRKDLLRQVEIDFCVKEPDIQELHNGKDLPEQVVSKLAVEKALNVGRNLNCGLVLAADTVVISGSLVYGKPANEEEAGQMLRILQGDSHEVLTALALYDAAENRVMTESQWGMMVCYTPCLLESS